ncbi:hypothetical protein GF314_13405 [bacterium]|nr:hypothetical protein [bacterium]
MPGPSPRHRPIPVACGLLVVLGVAAACSPVSVRRVETLDAIPGIDVRIAEVSGTRMLEIVVENRSGHDWSIAWDECAYVNPTGRAVDLETRHDRRERPWSPLPDGSIVEERCRVGAETLHAGHGSGQTSGTLQLVLVRGEEHRTWRGRLLLDVDKGTRPEDRPDGPRWSLH